MLSMPHRNIVIGGAARAKYAGGLIAPGIGIPVLFLLAGWSRLGAAVLSTVVLFFVAWACSVWFSGRMSISDSVVVLRPEGPLSSPISLRRADIRECAAFVRLPTTAKFILSAMLTLAFATRDGRVLYVGPLAILPRHLPPVQRAIEELGGTWRESV